MQLHNSTDYCTVVATCDCNISAKTHQHFYFHFSRNDSGQFWPFHGLFCCTVCCIFLRFWKGFQLYAGSLICNSCINNHLLLILQLFLDLYFWQLKWVDVKNNRFSYLKLIYFRKMDSTKYSKYEIPTRWLVLPFWLGSRASNLWSKLL